MRISPHARSQMSRRRIRPRHVELALRFGAEVHGSGAEFYVLRRRDIPPAMRRDPDVARAEGTTVVVCDDVVVTLYRNRDIRHLRRKLPWDARRAA